MIKIYSPSKGEKEMADWIENWLRERNIPFQSDHAGEAYGGNGRNIVAFVKGNTKERPLGFAAHMDQIEPCRNVNPVINGNISLKAVYRTEIFILYLPAPKRLV